MGSSKVFICMEETSALIYNPETNRMTIDGDGWWATATGSRIEMDEVEPTFWQQAPLSKTNSLHANPLPVWCAHTSILIMFQPLRRQFQPETLIGNRHPPAVLLFPLWDSCWAFLVMMPTLVVTKEAVITLFFISVLGVYTGYTKNEAGTQGNNESHCKYDTNMEK